MAGADGRRRALRSRRATAGDCAGAKKPLGPPAAAGCREIVHLRRKDGDDVLCLCVCTRHPALEREQSEIFRVRRSGCLPTDPTEHLRKDRNAPPAGHGSSGRREGGQTGEGSGLPLRRRQGGASGESALAFGRAEFDPRHGKEFLCGGELQPVYSKRATVLHFYGLDLSVAGSAIRPWVGEDFRDGRDRGADASAGRGGAGISSVDVLRVDAASGRGDLLLDAAAIDHRDRAQWRDSVAWDFLSAGGITARIGLRLVARWKSKRDPSSQKALPLDDGQKRVSANQGFAAEPGQTTT